MNNNSKSLLYACTTVMIWSTMSTVIKLVLGTIPSLEALALGSVAAFLFLLIINAATGKLRELKRYRFTDYLKMAGLGFLGLFLYSALYYKGIERLTAQAACILNYLWPIMIVIFACIILKEKMTIIKWISIVCSFLGIVVLTTSGSAGGAGGMDGLGVVCCLSAAICYGLFSVLNKKADYDQNIAMMVIWLTTAVCAFLTGPFLEEWVPVTGGVSWLGILWLGAATDGAAYLMWAIALRESENTAVIANLAYLIPFLSLILSAIVLKEEITGAAVASLVLIVGGILLQSIFSKNTV